MDFLTFSLKNICAESSFTAAGSSKRRYMNELQNRSAVLETGYARFQRKKTIAFYNGEITKKTTKAFSGLYGSYAQKTEKRGMLRLRMTAGRITKEKLAF